MNTTLTNSTSLDYTIFPILIISIHAVYFFLGLPLNVYVTILLFPSRGVMEVSDVFSWNQAIAEILFVLLGPFHSLCSINMKLCFFQPLGFFLGTSLWSRSVFQSCVCLERYIAVVHPVTYLRYKPLRYRVACSIVAWIFSLVIGVTCSCMYPNLPYKVFTAFYAIAFTVDVFCCVSILRKLRHPGPRDMRSDVSEMNAVKKKAFQVVSVNLLAFILENIPISVALGIQSILSEYESGIVSMVSLAINTVIALLQPLYVLHRAGKLQLIQCTHFSTCCIRPGKG